MKIRRTFVAPVAAGALVAAIAFAVYPAVAPVSAAEANPAPLVSGLPDFTDLVARTSAAVVSIQVTQAVPAAHERGGIPPGFEPGTPGFEFFRRFGGPMDPEDAPVRQGQGSGFIISPDGLILTNAHVVENADSVTVVMADKRELKARVVGMDATTDVAVLRVKADGLPTLRIGDAKSLKVGEWVMAIGSPFGFDHTVSAGVVSAKTRSLPNGGYVPFIQTDVALNPGNSGGPLLNLKGEVIGINSQIYSRSGGYMGLSFAIPIDLAMNVQQQLVAHGKVSRGRLGVTVQSLDQALADSFGLDRPRGALVGAVTPGMPAARAGLRAGDVITELNGQPVEDSAVLSRAIAETKPGRDVRVGFIRNGKPKTLDVALGTAEEEGTKVAVTGDETSADRLGVQVAPLGEALKARAGVDAGVIVERAAGAAARAGVRPGDIILAVNAKPVTSPGELATTLAKAPAKVALLVKRPDGELFIPVELGQG
jgi:serine protease Do